MNLITHFRAPWNNRIHANHGMGYADTASFDGGRSMDNHAHSTRNWNAATEPWRAPTNMNNFSPWGNGRVIAFDMNKDGRYSKEDVVNSFQMLEAATGKFDFNKDGRVDSLERARGMRLKQQFQKMAGDDGKMDRRELRQAGGRVFSQEAFATPNSLGGLMGTRNAGFGSYGTGYGRFRGGFQGGYGYRQGLGGLTGHGHYQSSQSNWGSHNSRVSHWGPGGNNKPEVSHWGPGGNNKAEVSHWGPGGNNQTSEIRAWGPFR